MFALASISQARWLVGLGALTGAMIIYFLTLSPAATLRPRMSPGGPAWLWPLIGKGRLPCERRGYSPDFIYREFDNYGQEGRRLYRSYLLIDLAFPFAYGPTLAISAALLGSTLLGIAPERAWFANAPLAAGVADWVENGLLLFVLSRYSMSKRHDRVVVAASGATVLKLVLIFGSLAAIVLGAVAGCIKGSTA